MATGPPGPSHKHFIPAKLPSPAVVPTVIAASTTAAGPSSSFDLGDKQKRWVVIGVSLNAVLLPVLRQFTGQEISKHFTSLKTAHAIDAQIHPTHLKKDGRFQLNYGSINNNKKKKKVHLYDYKVNSAEDLAKVYLEPHMAKLTGFDSTCDLSAVLGIQANASVFPALIQTNAKHVRSEVRNKWGHCNFDHWTEPKFSRCFQLMETLVRSLGLPPADETKVIDDLSDWEKKGLQLCMGCPVNADLLKLVSDEVASLELDVEQMRQTSKDEAQKVLDALQDVKNEIQKFDKRTEKLENRVEANRKEQTEHNQALSSAIRDISRDIEGIEIRQDKDEEDISVLGRRQDDLEATVSSVKDEKESLASQVEDVEVIQDKLEGRVRALEDQSNRSATANTFQAPSQNQWFCGRSKELENIGSHVKVADKTCSHTAICGLGGVGKTSLAIEYLWRYKAEYAGGVFWISGESNSLFKISLSDMARQIGTLKEDFHDTLSETIDWLRRRDQMWCLVVDNLDELEMSKDMQKLLTGHWKQAARGHIIVTSRREVREASEDTGIEERWCIELKCLTEEDGLQFLRIRTDKPTGEDEAIRKLFFELGGLPLALDQAAAYIRCKRCSVTNYVEQYQKQKLLLLQKQKARLHVDNTSPERLAVHTTWLLNFKHISQVSVEMELGDAVNLFMELSAFLGPDDIPYEVINQGLPQFENAELVKVIGSSLGPDEIMSLLTKLSLFQRYGRNSYSVHRLVQEVIRSGMKEERKEFVLSCATRVLHHALVNTQSPANVCERFVEDAVFSVDNPPSLHLWGKLASHATYLQEHLLDFASKKKVALLHTEESVRLLNETAIFFSVSHEKVKAQVMQKRKLEFLVHLEKPISENNLKELLHFDIPLKDRDYKVISHCMREQLTADIESNQADREDKANQLREQGNDAVKSEKFKEATDMYTEAIALSSKDYRLFSNRALCYLKLGKPQKALDDCEACLSLKPNYGKALQRKAWALYELVESGCEFERGRANAMAAVAIHFDGTARKSEIFKKMFPAVSSNVISDGSSLERALLAKPQCSTTILLCEGEYDINNFVVQTDLQVVGLGSGVVLKGSQVRTVIDAKCYLENIAFPNGITPFVCRGEAGAIHMRRCTISGGFSTCKDYPECNGGPGCKAPSYQKPMCDRTHKFGIPESSGIAGCPGIGVICGGCGHLENCQISDCGGGGALVLGEGSRLFVRNCEVFKNHQAGLEAREGGKLVAADNIIFDNGTHGILIGPKTGRSMIQGNRIFENAKEGVGVFENVEQVSVDRNAIHHNQGFALSLRDCRVSITNNKIFENGFWGILANTRTSADIKENVISSNKCGGIFIGINFSGQIQIKSNIVRDHNGPWLYKVDIINFPGASEILRSDPNVYLPPGESEYYSDPPTLNGNQELNNKEGIFHPRQVVDPLTSSFTCCRCSREVNEARLRRCPECYIAVYCGLKCQTEHLPQHQSLCSVLKRRYSTTVDPIPYDKKFNSRALRIFGKHLKGIGKGTPPKHTSQQTFIVKIQTGHLNCHSMQLLRVYDQTLTVDYEIQSPEVFSVIMECGVMGQSSLFTSKKAFFWAAFAESGKKLRIFLKHLAPYQEW